MNQNLTELSTICSQRIKVIFDFYLAKHCLASSLQQVMQYSLSNSGKLMRPIFVYATGRIFDIAWENLDVPASAIELLHSYSLIHDDLPAMDNADLRRGKPSCHKKFGEAMAILAGDALQPLCFEILSTYPSQLSPEQRLKMVQILAQASGYQGMVAGQALDIAGANSANALIEMYKLKTGALFTASVQLGMIAANITDTTIYSALTNYADHLGLAFQLQDDLLDKTSTTQITGKSSGLDTINNKITYLSINGVEKTQEAINYLIAEALNSIHFLGSKAGILRTLADYLLQRKK